MKFRHFVLFLFYCGSFHTTESLSVVKLEKRIVNGEAPPKRLPWLVSIQTEKRAHFCGGSLIQENVVITGNRCSASLI
jgi:hypothetical protein